MSDEKNNTGNWNTGNRNTGNRNTGDLNTGNRNTGDLNTGNRNTGNWNTGDLNTGDLNTGNWNTGDWNTGFFCTETPMASFFDKPTNMTHEQACEIIPSIELPVGVQWVASGDMSEQEKKEYPTHPTIGGYLKKHTLPYTTSFPLAWAKLSKEEKQKWLDLPNFDAEKFLIITGVDMREYNAQKTALMELISRHESMIANARAELAKLK